MAPRLIRAEGMAEGPPWTRVERPMDPQSCAQEEALQLASNDKSDETSIASGGLLGCAHAFANVGSIALGDIHRFRGPPCFKGFIVCAPKHRPTARTNLQPVGNFMKDLYYYKGAPIPMINGPLSLSS